ncbi:MAG: hypothetical protein NTW14_12365 [bacterium]|nr:hypothetical protein [bacterium]
MISFFIRILLVVVVINLLFRWLRGVFQEKKPQPRSEKPSAPSEPFQRSDIIDVPYTEVPPDEPKK